MKSRPGLTLASGSCSNGPNWRVDADGSERKPPTHVAPVESPSGAALLQPLSRRAFFSSDVGWRASCRVGSARRRHRDLGRCGCARRCGPCPCVPSFPGAAASGYRVRPRPAAHSCSRGGCGPMNRQPSCGGCGCGSSPFSPNGPATSRSLSALWARPRSPPAAVRH